jgi:hypothetical protein
MYKFYPSRKRPHKKSRILKLCVSYAINFQIKRRNRLMKHQVGPAVHSVSMPMLALKGRGVLSSNTADGKVRKTVEQAADLGRVASGMHYTITRNIPLLFRIPFYEEANLWVVFEPTVQTSLLLPSPSLSLLVRSLLRQKWTTGYAGNDTWRKRYIRTLPAVLDPTNGRIPVQFRNMKHVLSKK